MKTFAPLVLALNAVALVAPLGVQAETCAGGVSQQKSVSLDAPRVPTINFAGSGGGLDPDPLLRLSFGNLVERCLVAHFSALALPADNAIVFQVSVDGVPMEGQANYRSLGVPVLTDPNQSDVTGIDPERMVSYTLFAPVKPGRHVVEVKFADCCSPVITPVGASRVEAATLTLQY